jgi:hypothetical protein
MSQPGRVAQSLAACNDATEIELELEEDVRRTMAALQDAGADPRLDDEEAAVA